MIRYRVTYKDVISFGYALTQTTILESDVAISRNEIANALNINDDKIVSINII